MHEILTGKITQITHTPERTTSSTYARQGRVFVSKNQYRDVSARVTVYRRTSSAAITGSYQIIDVKTGRLKKSDAFVGKDEFVAVWGGFTGDEAALNGDDRAVCSQGESFPPMEEEMIRRAAHELALSLAQSLKLYAR